MLIKFRIPEIVLGALLATGIFAVGLVFVPSQPSSPHEAFWERTFSDPVAFFTLCVAAFTGVLGLSTIGLWLATRRTAKITEIALTETERPWIFLEGATITRRDPPNILNSWFIRLKWRNIGRMPALVEQCIFKIQDKATLAAAPNYSSPGELVCQYSVAPNTDFETNEVGPGPGRPEFLVFYGRLTYKELNGKLHHTGFALEVSPHIAAFSPYPSDAYTYYD